MENIFATEQEEDFFEAFTEYSNPMYQIPENYTLFPAHWLTERIGQVLYSEGSLELDSFPVADPETAFGKLILEHGFTKEESVLLCLALTAVFAPELLRDLASACKEEELVAYIGGFSAKGTGLFCPTVRTAVFLIAGKNLEKRSQYASYFHNRQNIFTSGIVSAQPLSPTSVFLDHQLVFSDQFLGTVLKGDLPRLDADAGFPVRRGKSAHLLEDVILNKKTHTQISKLRRFAKNMTRLWEIDTKGKVRSNFISIFSGDPGTGKSHAAEAIGNEIGLPVYKVNFAQMVSKYIGETEKNLEKVFDRFDKQPSILFFDEAESIFSKRTEVGDSHDQHANNLQSYLLQKVEEFNGIIILATNVQNLTQYFDRAFQRRFRLIVEFDFPDYPERLEIWKRSLFAPFTFEEGLPEKLAKNYQLSGGSIYNIVSDGVIEALEKETELITFGLLETAFADEFKKTMRKFEICTDEMAVMNPVKRFGVGYEQRKNF